jgi:hypothetical protein
LSNPACRSQNDVIRIPEDAKKVAPKKANIMLRVDFHSLQDDGSEEVTSSWVVVDDHIEVLGSGERVDGTSPDGEAHDPNNDPRDFLENLHREYCGSYSWAGHAYEDGETQVESADFGPDSPIEFENAYFIKLGRGGEWEEDSIRGGKLRLGWKRQTIDDINAKRWDVIRQQLQSTSDLNALRILAESSPEDIWITFHQAKLWWTRLASARSNRTKHPSID